MTADRVRFRDFCLDFQNVRPSTISSVMSARYAFALDGPQYVNSHPSCSQHCERGQSEATVRWLPSAKNSVSHWRVSRIDFSPSPRLLISRASGEHWISKHHWFNPFDRTASRCNIWTWDYRQRQAEYSRRDLTQDIPMKLRKPCIHPNNHICQRHGPKEPWLSLFQGQSWGNLSIDLWAVWQWQWFPRAIASKT